MVLQQLLTVADIARWFKISRGWVFDHAAGRRQPILPSVKLGKSLRFREEEVNCWLAELSRKRPA